MLPSKAGKALKKIKARLARGERDGGENDKLRSSWMGVVAAVSKMSLEEALAEDKKHEQKEEQNNRWFHFNTNRNLAEYKLKEAGKKKRMFLVRSNLMCGNTCVLSLVTGSGIIHYQIKERGRGCFSIEDGPLMRGLDQLIEFYSEDPNGLPLKLGTPVIGESPPAHCRALGYTNLLHQAIVQNDEGLALKILDHPLCPDVNAKNNKGCTAIHDASMLGMEASVIKLLEKGASLVIPDRHGYTPLMKACMKSQPNIIKLLMIMGKSDPQEMQVDTGNKVLHMAAMHGHLECIKVMLSLNTPAWPRNFDGETPREMALKAEHKHCAKLIEDHKPLPAWAARSDWYQGSVDKRGAELLLQKHGCKDGMFLVRKSSRSNDLYILVMTFELKTYNYEIQSVDNQLFFIDDGPYLPSLEHVIEYYSVRPEGLPCKLQIAVSTDGIEKLMPWAHHPTGADKSRPTSGGSNRTRPPAPPPTEAPPPRPLPVFDKEPVVLSPGSIELKHEIGEGEYGSVYKGIWTEPHGRKIDVAVKTLHVKHTRESRENFLREARVMVQLNHPFIVKLIGVCMEPPIMLVQELLPLGSLLDFLLDYPERISVDTDLYLWAAQIVCGMMYLEKERYVHRDLAARNILLADKKRVKVGDFGLSRATATQSNYYQASVGGRWPIKWYAPECVNYGTFSSKSDVWSYGVTLWEMFSFGEQPYGDKAGAQVIALIEKGERLSCPPRCPSAIYEMMLRCWEYDASKRTTFQELNETFHTHPEFQRTRSFVMLGSGHETSSSVL